MIIVLSPAKTLDYEFESNHKHSVPAFLNNSSKLIGELKEKEPKDIASVSYTHLTLPTTTIV